MPSSIVILTGAGISAESGIRTFRDANGLWENHRVEDVASPEGFERDPVLVYEFYNQRRRQLLSPEVQPNPAHIALARLEQEWCARGGEFLLVTQNVDDLHDRAGSHSLIHMHGELLRARCLECEQVFEWREDLSAQDRCAQCASAKRMAALRPHIVWFGEMPLRMEEIMGRLASCDVFVSVGTSSLVYPAAGFVSMAQQARTRIEVNVEATNMSRAFTDHRVGKASEEVPRLVEELLKK